ncbi:MAG: DUF2063 domain-containing protein [Gammaproteobacteria bacterium]
MADIVIDHTRPGALAAYQQAFTAYLRDPAHAPAVAGLPTARQQLYHELVFGNLERVMGNMFPVLKSRVDAALWQQLVQDFLRAHPMQDPLFQSMPRAFLDFLLARGVHEDEPPWLLELAHYEWVEFALSIAMDEDPPAGEADGDLLAGRPRLTSYLWLLQYAWPVQRLRAEAPAALTQAEPVYLAAWRDADDRVRFLELAPSAARLLELLGEDAAGSGADALRALAMEINVVPDAAFMAAGEATFETWRAAGIIVVCG